MYANREELVECIGQAMRADGTAQPLSGLHLYRHTVPLEQVYSVVDEQERTAMRVWLETNIALCMTRQSNLE